VSREGRTPEATCREQSLPGFPIKPPGGVLLWTSETISDGSGRAGRNDGFVVPGSWASFWWTVSTLQGNCGMTASVCTFSVHLLYFSNI